MKLWVTILLLVLFWGCSCEGESLVEAPPCYPGQTRECTSGLCPGPGVQTCREDSTWGPCEGFQKPEIERCDGVDNDCDGFTDEWDPNLGKSCGSSVGECHKGYYVCNGGNLECIGEQPPRGEVCDGLDNDCDGETDEDIEPRLCYSLGIGSPTEGVGICHVGVELCQRGNKVCLGEQLPEEEQCNGLDNNCDGEIDAPSDPGDIDIAFLVDQSGSMKAYIDAVKTGLVSFVEGLDPSVHVAIIGVPIGENQRCGLVTDFVEAPASVPYFSTLISEAGGSEPTYPCVFGACIQEDNPLGLSWRSDAIKNVVLITNEGCASNWCEQSCRTSENYWCSRYVEHSHKIGPDDVSNVCSTEGVRVHTIAPSSFAPTYGKMCFETSGWFAEMPAEPGEFVDILVNLVQDIACAY